VGSSVAFGLLDGDRWIAGTVAAILMLAHRSGVEESAMQWWRTESPTG